MTGRPPSYMRPRTTSSDSRKRPVEGLESEFQTTVLDLAKWKGYTLVYHTYDSRKSHPGWPDLVLIKLGRNGKPTRMVCLELKRHPRKPTPAQLAWVAALDTVPGVDAMVAYPEDLAAIERLLS